MTNSNYLDICLLYLSNVKFDTHFSPTQVVIKYTILAVRNCLQNKVVRLSAITFIVLI